jgi:hypothetical protein
MSQFKSSLPERPVEGQGITQDQLAQGQPADHKRVLQNK